MQNQTNTEHAPEHNDSGEPHTDDIQRIVHEPRYWLFAVVMSVALSVVVGGVVYFWMLGQVDLVGTTLSARISELEGQVAQLTAIQNAPDENDAIAPANDEISTADWKVFTSKEIGFLFNYPSRFNEIVFTLRSGYEGGEKFEGRTAGNTGFAFGGATADFAEGRGAIDTDIVSLGYNNGTYQFIFATNKVIEIPERMIVKEFVASGERGVIITGDYELFGPGDDKYEAFIPLHNEKFGAITIKSIAENALTLIELEQIVESFELIN